MVIQRTYSIISRFSALQWWAIAVALLVIRQVALNWLDGLYAQSLFPVSFFVGQTTFDADKVKSYYAVLLELGTMSRYFWVQIADYVFMLTVFTSFFALMTAVYRSLPDVAFLKKIGWAMIFFAPMAAVFDALENFVSFFMIANPTDFADWLVYPYSSFAVTKFAIFGLAYLWAMVAVVISIGTFLTICVLNQLRKTV